jgi:hypothetical protein
MTTQPTTVKKILKSNDVPVPTLQSMTTQPTTVKKILKSNDVPVPTLQSMTNTAHNR